MRWAELYTKVPPLRRIHKISLTALENKHCAPRFYVSMDRCIYTGPINLKLRRITPIYYLLHQHMMSGLGCVAYNCAITFLEPIFAGWPDEIMINKNIGRTRRGSTQPQN